MTWNDIIVIPLMWYVVVRALDSWSVWHVDKTR